MKPALILSLVAALLLAGLAVVSAQTATCTDTGTQTRDVMAGTRGRDVMCALGGNDYVHGNGGRDILFGGAGPDMLVSGKGRDRLHGQGGNDRLFIVDNRSNDFVRGGPGEDQCFVDEADTARGCERVFRGHSITAAQYNALQQGFYRGLVVAEELIAEGSPSPFPVTVTATVTQTATVTVTRTANFPPCTPPPDQTPAPC